MLIVRFFAILDIRGIGLRARVVAQPSLAALWMASTMASTMAITMVRFRYFAARATETVALQVRPGGRTSARSLACSFTNVHTYSVAQLSQRSFRYSLAARSS